MIADLRLTSWPWILPSTLAAETPFVYIAAVGFEDRGFAWWDRAISRNVLPSYVVAIEYKPQNSKNRKGAFKRCLSQSAIPREAQVWLSYERFTPNEFSAKIADVIKELSFRKIVIDISSMSKLLIVILITQLRKYTGEVEVIYTEAEVYYPLREQFIAKVRPAAVGTFLTKNVYTIATTESLASMGNQGLPVVTVAFATFNYKELDALANEISPQAIIVIYGAPHIEEADGWRLDALRTINAQLEAVANSQQKTLPTFDYTKTVEFLEDVYDRHGDTHKIVVAPTGSKLQALGVALFKYLRPDTTIVYPVTSGFSKDYTVGYKEIWSLRFRNWPEFVKEMQSYRKADLKRLMNVIDAAAC